MDITDIFPIDQIEELRKYGLLNETHYIRYVIGREFSLLLAEGKTYHEVSVVLGDKVWDFFGEKRCFDEGSVKNIFIWYTKQMKSVEISSGQSVKFTNTIKSNQKTHWHGN